MKSLYAVNIGKVLCTEPNMPFLNRLFGTLFINVFETNLNHYYYDYPNGRGLATADHRWHIKNLPNTEYIDGSHSNNTFHLSNGVAGVPAFQDGEYVLMSTDDNIGLKIVDATGSSVTLGAFSRAQESMLIDGVATLTWINRQVVTISGANESSLRVASVAVGGAGTSSCRKVGLVANDGIEPALWLAGKVLRPDYTELHKECKLIRTHDLCSPSSSFYLNYNGGVEPGLGASCLDGGREAEVDDGTHMDVAPDGVLSPMIYVPRDSGEAGMTILTGPETVARVCAELNYSRHHFNIPVLMSDSAINEWFVRYNEINPISIVHSGGIHNENWNPIYGRARGTGRAITSRLGLTAYFRGDNYPNVAATADGNALAWAGLMYKWGVAAKASFDVRGAARTVLQVEGVDFEAAPGTSDYTTSFSYGFGTAWQYDQKPFQLLSGHPQQNYTVAQILDDTSVNVNKSIVCLNAYVYPFNASNVSYSTNAAALVADGAETWTDAEWAAAYTRCIDLLETYYAYHAAKMGYYFPNGGVEFAMYEAGIDTQFLVSAGTTLALRARVESFLNSKLGIQMRCDWYNRCIIGKYRYLPYYQDCHYPYGWSKLVPLRSTVPNGPALCHRSMAYGRGATFDLALANALTTTA